MFARAPYDMSHVCSLSSPIDKHAQNCSETQFFRRFGQCTSKKLCKKARLALPHHEQQVLW